MIGFILAGGASRRMGRSKAFLDLGGVTVIERVASLLKPLFAEVAISTNDPERYGHLGLPVYRDLVSDCGPLGGIYTALKRSPNFANFFVPCDMPFVREDHIRRLMDVASGADVVLYRHEYFEPLLAIYTRNCLGAIEKMLTEGVYSVLDLFPRVNVREVAFTEDRSVFLSVNTPEDYRIALERFRMTFSAASAGGGA